MAYATNLSFDIVASGITYTSAPDGSNNMKGTHVSEMMDLARHSKLNSEISDAFRVFANGAVYSVTAGKFLSATRDFNPNELFRS